MYGRPGFKEILLKLNEAWRTKSHEIIDGSKDAMKDIVTSIDRQRTNTDQQFDLPSKTSIQTCFAYFANDFDDENGGFGTQPKFPQPGSFVDPSKRSTIVCLFSKFQFSLDSWRIVSSSERKSGFCSISNGHDAIYIDKNVIG